MFGKDHCHAYMYISLVKYYTDLKSVFGLHQSFRLIFNKEYFEIKKDGTC